MNKYTILLGLSAILLAICSAYFSIIGLSQLFAGASLAIIFMAGSLEFAKLISASFLYFYWKRVTFLIKTYLLIGVFILIGISSIGIYGFLTAAYQDTSDKISLVENEIQNYQDRQDRYNSQIEEYQLELNQVNKSLSNLSEGITRNQIQYVDQETGQLVTTTSRTQRESIELEIADYRDRRGDLNNKIDGLRDSVNKYQTTIFELEQQSNQEADLGPLKFIASVSNIEMDRIVNYLTLAIVFVFDPLAVILIIALSTAINFQDKNKSKKSKKSSKRLVGNKNLLNQNNKETGIKSNVTQEPEQVNNTVLDNDDVLDDEHKRSKQYPSLT